MGVLVGNGVAVLSSIVVTGTTVGALGSAAATVEVGVSLSLAVGDGEGRGEQAASKRTPKSANPPPQPGG